MTKQKIEPAGSRTSVTSWDDRVHAQDIMADAKFSKELTTTIEHIKQLLLRKNTQYGDSIFNPVRVFSKGDPIEQIRVRIDDKISRMNSSPHEYIEDTVTDLIGYLIMYQIAMRRQRAIRNK